MMEISEKITTSSDIDEAIHFSSFMDSLLSKLSVHISAVSLNNQESLAIQKINLEVLSRKDNRIRESLHQYILAIYDGTVKDGNILSFYCSKTTSDFNMFYFHADMRRLAAVGKCFEWTRLFRQQYVSALEKIIKNQVQKVCASEEASDFSAIIYESKLTTWLKKRLLPFTDSLFSGQNLKWGYYQMLFVF